MNRTILILALCLLLAPAACLNKKGGRGPEAVFKTGRGVVLIIAPAAVRFVLARDGVAAARKLTGEITAHCRSMQISRQTGQYAALLASLQALVASFVDLGDPETQEYLAYLQGIVTIAQVQVEFPKIDVKEVDWGSWEMNQLALIDAVVPS